MGRRAFFLTVSILVLMHAGAWACWGCFTGYRNVNVSRDGRLVAASSGYAWDGTARTSVWSMDGRRLYTLPYGGTVSFGPQGRLAVGGLKGEMSQVWIVEASSGRVLRSLAVGGGNSSRTVPEVTWTRGGDLLTCANGGRSFLPVRRWSVTTGRKLADYAPYSEVKLSADGRWAALGGGEDVRLVDLARGQRVKVWTKAGLGNLGWGGGRLFLHQDRRLLRVDPATLQEDRWALDQFSWVGPSGLLASIKESPSHPWMEFRDFGGDAPRSRIEATPGVLSGDGRWFGNETGIWQVATGNRVATLPGQGALAFSPTGSKAVYAHEGQIRILDLAAAARADLPGSAEVSGMALDVSSGAAAVARGREIFMGAGTCNSCHGDTGAGDGPAGPALDPQPRDLRHSSAYQWGADRRGIFRTIYFGGTPGSPMQPFGERAGGVLTQEQVEDVTAFVLSLQRR